jgi:peptide/nickel transport system substrate-binding protein
MAESQYWNRFWRKRISRRALLGAGAVTALGAASGAIVGCNGGGSSATTDHRTPTCTDAGLTPTPGGGIIAGRSVNALGIDPHQDLMGLDLDALIYTYLYSWNPYTEQMVMNNFATEFEHPDDLTFIFTLRPDVKIWPVGPAADEILTSNDCLESFKRRSTAVGAPDKRFPNRIDHFNTPDLQTFGFVMSQPFVPSIREMANPTWAIVPAKVLEAYPSLSQVAFGSGPLMMEEFRGYERIVMRKHPNFFLKPKPWLDTLTQIVITENSSLLAAFKSGDHGICGAIIDKPTYQDLKEDDRFCTTSTPTLYYPVIHIKMKDPWRDIRVREALDLAINRDELIDVVANGEGNYNGPIQWAQTKWALPQDELRAFYRYDPERAKALLAEAGYSRISARVKAPELTGPTIFGDMIQLIQNQVKVVGFDFDIDFVELGGFITSTLLPGNFELSFFPNLPYDEPDRPLSFHHSRGVSGAGNWNNYTNPELDVLIDEQSEEFDEEKRKEIILKAQRMILPEHGPSLPLIGGIAHLAQWSYVHFGPEGPHMFIDRGTEPPPNASYGPSGSEIWTEKV